LRKTPSFSTNWQKAVFQRHGRQKLRYHFAPFVKNMQVIQHPAVQPIDGGVPVRNSGIEKLQSRRTVALRIDSYWSRRMRTSGAGIEVQVEERRVEI